MQNLTVKQLTEACNNNKYLLLRFRSGHLMGVNCRVADIVKKRQHYPDTQETDFISFIPCGLLEYIEHKAKYYIPQ
jgi:hypothetical protein